MRTDISFRGAHIGYHTNTETLTYIKYIYLPINAYSERWFGWKLRRWIYDLNYWLFDKIHGANNL